MKRKKIFNILVIAFLLFIPFNVLAIDKVSCGNVTNIPKKLPQLTNLAVTLLEIAVPVLLVIMGSLDFFKAITENDGDSSKCKKAFIKRIINAVLVFFIIVIVKFVISIAADSLSSKNMVSCIDCFLNGTDKCAAGVSSNSTPTSTLIFREINEFEYELQNADVSSKSIAEIIKEKKATERKIKEEQKKAKEKNNGSGSLSSKTITNSDSGLKSFKYGDWTYYLYVPKTVSEDKPLIVHLHGNYMSSSTLDTLDGYGYSYQIKTNKKEYPAYILMPHLSKQETWSGNKAKLIKLIDQVVDEYGISRDRISISGHSMGADDIVDIYKTYPDYFSAVVFMAPGNLTSAQSSIFKKVPTYVLYGQKDSYSNKQGTRDFASNIGSNAKIKMYPGEGHDVVNTIITDSEVNIANWMINQRRS